MTEAVPTAAQPITIRVKCIDSTVHEVTASPQQTISELKAELSQVPLLFFAPLSSEKQTPPATEIEYCADEHKAHFSGPIAERF